jgi:Tfp pilus assembly protein PilX
MTSRLREESGLALIQTLMLSLLMVALGIALVMQVSGQQRESFQERTRESSFNLAEAALNAQIAQLARAWPTIASAAASSCDATTTSNSTCPTAATIANGYSGGDYGSSAANAWRTSLRDNATGERYWTTAVTSRAAYDANNDGSVWVRSTTRVQGNLVSIVGLATRNVTPIDFPNNVVSANWFATNNQGRKVIVDTLGSYAQPPSVRPGPAAKPARLGVRCANLTRAQCLNYPADKGQVQPDTAAVDTGAATSAVSASQLQALERQAASAGTLYTTCPSGNSSLSSVNGAPVVIKTATPCSVSINGGSVNTAANPGVIVVENGTLSLGGNATFYGLVYMVNQQNSSGAVVTISGNASIQGIVAVDGNGGVLAGSSKTNLIYDSRAATLLRGDSGATLDKSSFRVLPQNTP